MASAMLLQQQSSQRTSTLPAAAQTRTSTTGISLSISSSDRYPDMIATLCIAS
ncbi:hypothetical protein PC119_g24107 [Phytophthora cactorum]|nr:hypothetical protein PC119_g24107 [Phytophthora cactorum]